MKKSDPNVTKARSVPAPAAASRRVEAMLGEAKRALQKNDAVTAERVLLGVLALSPGGSECLRLLGTAAGMQGRAHEATEWLSKAVEADPADALAYNSLGNALGKMGDKTGAAAAFARACELAPDVAPFWHNRAKALSEDLRYVEALPSLEKAVALAPKDLRARFLYAQALRVTGQGDGAKKQYRQALTIAPSSGEAWLGLSNLKNLRFDAVDVREMERSMQTESNVDDAISIRFALARGYEDTDRYQDAFRMYLDANAKVRQWHAWDAAKFSGRVSDFLQAFTPPPQGAADGQGGEVIFIVSMPRSGSSLTEQILASHSQVDGAGELLDLPAVLQEESARRGTEFPAWVADSQASDWQRLGAAYLQRTARWRADKPRFTDKLPDNWRHIGAILTMLPGARVVVCVRDPVETALACFRQLFAGGAQAFSYALSDIVAYTGDFHRAIQRWSKLFPDRIYVQHYESLLDDFEQEVRALLKFCALPFEPACLRFHETERTVRTASAGQVREPLRKNTARAQRYGALLDPLRAGLSALRTDGA